MLNHLWITYDCFHVAIAELRSTTEIVEPAKLNAFIEKVC